MKEWTSTELALHVAEALTARMASDESPLQWTGPHHGSVEEGIRGLKYWVLKAGSFEVELFGGTSVANGSRYGFIRVNNASGTERGTATTGMGESTEAALAIVALIDAVKLQLREPYLTDRRHIAAEVEML